MKTVQEMTDEELKRVQKQVLKVCAFCENGQRIGIKTPLFIVLAYSAQKSLEEIETEFFKRHPAEIQNRYQQFLRACEMLLDNHNFEEYGIDKAAAGTEYFTEYNLPDDGKKTVVCRKTFLIDGEEPRQEKTSAVYAMKPFEFLFSDIENAMDEFAQTLPDVPAGDNTNAITQES